MSLAENPHIPKSCPACSVRPQDLRCDVEAQILSPRCLLQFYSHGKHLMFIDSKMASTLEGKAGPLGSLHRGLGLTHTLMHRSHHRVISCRNFGLFSPRSTHWGLHCFPPSSVNNHVPSVFTSPGAQEMHLSFEFSSMAHELLTNHEQTISSELFAFLS